MRLGDLGPNPRELLLSSTIAPVPARRLEQRPRNDRGDLPDGLRKVVRDRRLGEDVPRRQREHVVERRGGARADDGDEARGREI